MRKLKIIIAVALFLLTGLTVFFMVLNQPGFTGERIKNPDAYLLDIQRMHGTDRHTMHLVAGDVLEVTFETEKGSLHMEITAPDGAALYTGNGKDATEFEINISQTGAYIISVEARHAEGKIHIQLKEQQK